ncbi:hypothetical protein [Arthrobacter sp. yr096]|uniref:hypothetical protein n=1 Tax=Arthrobacter sp. yr096 TaxID=1761750 RepID=UPI00115FF48E|nr:hypothetical protein [Arthrobacter sp. yr096]
MGDPLNADRRRTEQLPSAAWNQDDVSRPQGPAVTLGDIPAVRYGATGLAKPSQLALAFALLAPSWIVFTMAATSREYDGVGSFIGWILGGIIAPPFAILIAVVLGLPLRLVPSINRWWAGNGRIYLLTAAAGLALIVAGYVKPVQESVTAGGTTSTAEIPDGGLLFAGWFVIAVLLVNASLPLRWVLGEHRR